MPFQTYLELFAVAFVGMALHTVLKLKALQDKAQKANIAFNAGQYFKEDWLSVVASTLTIILFLLFVDNILKWKPQAEGYLNLIYAFVGYTGNDLASRLFGVINKKINAAIDQKTTIADQATGTENIPTQLPKKEDKQV